MAWWISPAPICCNGTTDPDEDVDGLPRDPDRRRSRSWLTSIAGHSSIAAVLQDSHLRLTSSSAYLPAPAALERWGRGWGWRKSLASLQPLLQPAPQGAPGEYSPPSPASARTSSSAAGEAPLLVPQASPAALAQDTNLIQYGPQCVGDSNVSSDLLGGGQLPGPEVGPTAIAVTALLTATRLRRLLQGGSASASEILHVLCCAVRDQANQEHQAGTPSSSATRNLFQDLQLPAEVAELVSEMEDSQLRCPAVADAVEERLRHAACLGLVTAVQARIGGTRYRLPPPRVSIMPPHNELPPALRRKTFTEKQEHTFVPPSTAPPPVEAAPAPVRSGPTRWARPALPAAAPAAHPLRQQAPVPASSTATAPGNDAAGPGEKPRRTRWAPAAPAGPPGPAAPPPQEDPQDTSAPGASPPPATPPSPGPPSTPVAAAASVLRGSSALVPEDDCGSSSEEEGEVVM